MKPLQRLLASLVILPLFGLGCLQIGPRIVRVPDAPDSTLQTTPEQATATAQAYLVLDGGVANITRAGTLFPAQEGTELAAGDEVSVTNGTVTLVYPDAGESRLEAGTKVTILADGVESGSLFTEVQLVAGSMWTRFEKVFGPGERFSVASNGVVATVRGTAFGVSIQDGDVDVQVAEHEVEVSSEADEEAGHDDAQAPAKAVRVAAGEGIKLRAAQFAVLSGPQLKGLSRKLSKAEQAGKGYKFGTEKIKLEKLKKPKHPVKLPVAPRIPPEFLQRMMFLQNRAVFEAKLRGFVAPTRGALQSELAPLNTTIQIQGPTSTP